MEETFDPTTRGMQVFPSAREYSRLADDTGFVAVTNDATDGRITDDTLRKSREWFRAIFEQAAVGMAEVDLEGRWIRVNDRLCDMLGYTRDELLAMTFWGLTHPDDLAAELAHFQRLLADELATVTMEKRYLHRNSSHLWVSSTLSPVRDQAGNLQYFIAVVEDISRRKLVETALRESEQRFRRLFDDAPLPSYLIDLSDAAIVDCNAAAATMLGYERDALRRMRVPDIEAATEEGDLVAREPVMGVPVQFETQHRTRSGEIRDVVIASVPVDIAGRRLTYTTVVDVTERKRAEARFRATFDHAAVGIAHIAPDGRFLRVNQHICANFGYSREELLRRSVHELVDPEQREEVVARLRSVALGEVDSYTGDRRYIAADGRVLVVSVTVSMVHDRAEPPYFLVVAQDVSDRKKAEAELRRMTVDLEARVRQEVAARETAQNRAAQAERLQALGQLAGGIAHDFNNVLQAVQGSASLITLRAGDAAAVQRYARIVVDAADRGASITRRLLAFASRGDLRAEAIEPAVILEGMHDILVPTLGAAITVRVVVEPGLPQLLADRSQLETALVNLAANARDAMPRGGTLTLSAAADVLVSGDGHRASLPAGRYVRIAVADTGTGMDEATLAQAFQPFFTTKPRGQGTGLGLAMVKGFVQQSGGGVAIDSAPGSGTTVEIWLPQAAAEAPRPGARSAIAGREGNSALARYRKHVLVVNDDPLVLETLAAQLEEAGLLAVTARDGPNALAALEGDLPVHVLVSDLSMPGMDGVNLIVEAKARCPGLPAILLTGYAGDAAPLALTHRIDQPFILLRKPIHGSELADRISSLLTGHEKPRPPGQVTGGFPLDRGDSHGSVGCD